MRSQRPPAACTSAGQSRHYLGRHDQARSGMTLERPYRRQGRTYRAQRTAYAPPMAARRQPCCPIRSLPMCTGKWRKRVSSDMITLTSCGYIAIHYALVGQFSAVAIREYRSPARPLWRDVSGTGI